MILPPAPITTVPCNPWVTLDSAAPLFANVSLVSGKNETAVSSLVEMLSATMSATGVTEILTVLPALTVPSLVDMLKTAAPL